MGRVIPKAGERGSGLFVATCVCAVSVLPSALCAVVFWNLAALLLEEPSLVGLMFCVFAFGLAIAFSLVGALTLVAAVVLAVIFAVMRHRALTDGTDSTIESG